jgi:hypothetical protein
MLHLAGAGGRTDKGTKLCLHDHATLGGCDRPHCSVILSWTDKNYSTHRQLQDLAAAPGKYGMHVFVMGHCGLRQGEMAALRVQELDLSAAG